MKKSKPKPLTGRELKRWREQSGLLQSQVALKLGVTDGTVSHWERGRHPMTPRTQLQIRQMMEKP